MADKDLDFPYRDLRYAPTSTQHPLLSRLMRDFFIKLKFRLGGIKYLMFICHNVDYNKFCEKCYQWVVVGHNIYSFNGYHRLDLC